MFFSKQRRATTSLIRLLTDYYLEQRKGFKTFQGATLINNLEARRANIAFFILPAQIALAFRLSTRDDLLDKCIDEVVELYTAIPLPEYLDMISNPCLFTCSRAENLMLFDVLDKTFGKSWNQNYHRIHHQFLVLQIARYRGAMLKAKVDKMYGEDSVLVDLMDDRYQKLVWMETDSLGAAIDSEYSPRGQFAYLLSGCVHQYIRELLPRLQGL